MADPDRRRLPHSRPGLTELLDFIAKARFCAFSCSENRTKLELNQNCMDSMTSLQYFNYSACDHVSIYMGKKTLLVFLP